MSDCFDHETMAYESQDWSIFEDGRGGRYAPRMVTCRHCKKTGLTWGIASGGWRLFAGGAPHVCSTASDDDFDALE